MSPSGTIEASRGIPASQRSGVAGYHQCEHDAFRTSATSASRGRASRRSSVLASKSKNGGSITAANVRVGPSAHNSPRRFLNQLAERRVVCDPFRSGREMYGIGLTRYSENAVHRSVRRLACSAWRKATSFAFLREEGGCALNRSSQRSLRSIPLESGTPQSSWVFD